MTAGRHALRAAGVVLAVVAGAAVFVAAAVLSARLHLEVAEVRRVFAAEASRLASGAVAGSMTVEGMHAPRDGRWKFDRFVIRAPGGSRTMVLHGVAVSPVWGAMLRERGFIADRAEVESGRILIGVPSEGKTSLERALASASAGGEGEGDGGGSSQDTPAREASGRDRAAAGSGGSERGAARGRSEGGGAGEGGGSGASLVRIEGLAFRELVLAIAPAGGPRLRFDGLTGRGMLRLDHGEEVLFRAWGIEGRGALERPSLSIALDGMKVWIDGGRNVVATVVGRTEFAGGWFPLAYEHDSQQAKARICAWTGDSPLSTKLVMRALGGAEALASSDGLELRVESGSAPAEPRCGAAS